MQARIKATEQICAVLCVNYIERYVVLGYPLAETKMHIREVELFALNGIDWEQRLFECVKDLVANRVENGKPVSVGRAVILAKRIREELSIKL